MLNPFADIHEWDGGPTFAPKEGHPHGVTKETIPIGFGHEFSGTVLEVGEGVEGLIKGQHVSGGLIQHIPPVSVRTDGSLRLWEGCGKADPDVCGLSGLR